MRAISIRAFLLSNLTDIALVVVGGFAILFVSLVVETVALGKAPAQDVLGVLSTSSWFGPLIYSWIGVGDFLAGYVGGQIAEEYKPLNGALGSSVKLAGIFGLWIYVSIFGQVFHPHHHIAVPDALAYATIFGGPVFSLFGGFIASRIEPRIFWRWLAAPFAALVVYVIVLAVSLKFVGQTAFMFSAGLAMITGAFVAPTENRKRTYMGFAAAAILIPLAALIVRMAATGSSAGVLWPVFNAIGAAFGYTIMRRSWPA